jgi:MFS family permease
MGGIVLGPLAGIGLAGLGGLGMPFLVLACCLALVLVGLVVTTATAAGYERSADGDPPLAPARRPALPSRRPVVALLLLSAAAQLPTGLYDALWSRLLTDRGASSFLIGLSLTLFGLPIVVLAPFGGRLAGRHGPLRVAGAALVIAAGFMASYGFVTVPMAILALGVIEACFQAVAIPGAFAAVAEVFPDDWAATGQGWFSGAGTATAGTAAVLGAPAYGAHGPGVVFGGGALCSIALVGAAVFVGRGRYRRS